MSEKKDELSPEELEAASGAGEYTVGAQRVVPRGTMKRGVHGTDPGNVGNTDPITGELDDRALGGMAGGVEAQKTSNRGTYGTGQVETDPSGEIEPNPIVDTRQGLDRQNRVIKP